MNIRIYATLRPIVGDAQIATNLQPGQSVRDLVDDMVARWPDLRPEMLDKNNNLLNRIHIFVNGRSIRYLDGIETEIGADDNIAIFPPVGGG